MHHLKRAQSGHLACGQCPVRSEAGPVAQLSQCRRGPLPGPRALSAVLQLAQGGHAEM